MLTRWSVLIVCYIAIRLSQRKDWVLWGIILIGVIEAFLAMLQRCHWLSSRHSEFDMTGTFANPGPLGGFLAVVVVVLWGLYQRDSSQRMLKLVLFIMLVSTGIVLILTDSRAGWLAAISGYICIWHFSGRRFQFPSYVYIIITLLVGFLLVGVYFHKKDSTNGRFLIWRVSTTMIADAPLTGHGIGFFPEKYMYYQAQYFEENPDSKLNNLADNIIYPYNEYLRVGVEFGILGMLAVLFLIIAIFKYAILQGNTVIYLGALTSLLVFAMFSYPAEVFLLLLLFPFLIGGIECKKSFLISITPAHRYMLGGLCVFVLCWAGYVYYRYVSLESKVEKLYIGSSVVKHVDPAKYIQMHMNELKPTPRLLDLYAQYSFRHLPLTESLPIVEFTTTIVPTSEIFCDLGDLYLQQDQIEKAIECYQLSSHMIPHRILPKYKLFQLYRNVGDTIQMKIIGERLLSTSVKVESTQTLQIKGEVKKQLFQK